MKRRFVQSRPGFDKESDNRYEKEAMDEPCASSPSSSMKNDGTWTTTPDPMIPVHFGFTSPAVKKNPVS